MVKIKRTRVGEFAQLEEGLYEATIDDIELVDIEGYGQRLRFIFKVETEDEPEYVNGLANPKINERSKLWKWLKAAGIDPEDYDVGEEIDLNQLIGRKVMVRIENRKAKSGDFEFSNVTDVLPATRKPKKK